jgi:hypothetical protein
VAVIRGNETNAAVQMLSVIQINEAISAAAKLEKGRLGYNRFRIPEQTGELAALTASSGQKTGPKRPPSRRHLS